MWSPNAREWLCVLADCNLSVLGASLNCFCGWRIAGLCRDPLTKQLWWRQPLPSGFVSQQDKGCAGSKAGVCAWCVHLCWLGESWNLEMLLAVWGSRWLFIPMNCLFRYRLGQGSAAAHCSEKVGGMRGRNWLNWNSWVFLPLSYDQPGPAYFKS